ncbi:hypothetical protein [Sediminicoccus rosea]|uniref:Uncharacterized protein n=1 Tax=Sediminicoccus rosea TaxID=1225128 RepID=A0ABZ0PD20_9PROT|nr:hypothetical protein [Sediminicoccus rosea]WPB83377.1 hypothetical protein R9Z33_14840 [Sediminicoccus rosea]
MRLASLVILGLAAAVPQIAAPAAAQPAPHDLLGVARQIELDDSEEEVLRELGKADWLTIETPRALPNGVSRLILAVPTDDGCMPSGAPLVCPAIRVVLMMDPSRGARVSRIEAFTPLPGTQNVIEVFRNASDGLGPPLQTESWAEQIRGMPRHVWRQRWRPDASEGTFMEVVVTADLAAEQSFGLANPAVPALGLGFVLSDPAIEDSTMAARRRVVCRPGSADCG